MMVLAKIIWTIITIAVFVTLMNFATGSIATGLSIGLVLSIITIWQFENPNKKEISIKRRKIIKRAENIFLLIIIALIITMVILKYRVLG